MSIKATELAVKVKSLAHNFPDRKEVCIYYDTTHGHACCIVGQAMVDLGVNPEIFNEETLNEGTPVNELWAVDDLLEEDSPAALNFLQAMQGYQDRGLSWGRAWEMAKSKFPVRLNG